MQTKYLLLVNKTRRNCNFNKMGSQLLFKSYLAEIWIARSQTKCNREFDNWGTNVSVGELSVKRGRSLRLEYLKNCNCCTDFDYIIELFLIYLKDSDLNFYTRQYVEHNFD